MNNKGSFMLWIEIIILIGMFLTILAIVGINLNADYSTDNDLTIGLNLSGDLKEINDFRSKSLNQTGQGIASITDFGIFKLASTPSILMSAGTLIWNFLSGKFIVQVITSLNLGGQYAPILIVGFQTIYVLAIIFLFIKLVLRLDI